VFDLSVTQIVDVVRAVIAAKTRIYLDVPYGTTFFGANDIWKYIEIGDDKLCPVCRANAHAGIGDEIGEYRGNRIRGFFPYLEILDVNTIKVNAHPNCRCVMVRVHTIEQKKST